MSTDDHRHHFGEWFRTTQGAWVRHCIEPGCLWEQLSTVDPNTDDPIGKAMNRLAGIE